MKLTVKPSQKYKGVGDWGGGLVFPFSYLSNTANIIALSIFSILQIKHLQLQDVKVILKRDSSSVKNWVFSLGFQFGWIIFVGGEAVGVLLNPMYLIYNKQIGYWKNLIVKGCSTHILAYFLLMESCKQDFWSNNPFAMITSQFELHLKCRFLLVQKKKVISMNYSNSTIS